MTAKPEKMPIWDELLSAGARLQTLVPGAVLVGGTAAAMIAGHRLSQDADHVVSDLRSRFDDVLGDLESVAGWKTARIKRPVLILGSLDGIETGVRQLIRTEPLETQKVPAHGPGSPLVEIPTPEEILRIKAALILKRNATRDYVDVAALTRHLGEPTAARALAHLDVLYPQENGQSAIQQLLVQLNEPRPYDLDSTDLRQYKGLNARWHDWEGVHRQLRMLAGDIMETLVVGKVPRSGQEAQQVRGAPSEPDLETIVDLTTDISEIGPGRTTGRIRFDWASLSDSEKAERLAQLDRHPREFKARLADLWRERDPGGFKAWVDGGRKPSDNAPDPAKARSDKGYDPF